MLWVISNHTLDAITQQDYVPIDDQAQGQATQFQISKQLGQMDRKNLFYSLILHEDQLVNSHVNTIADLDESSLKLQRHGYFTFNLALSPSQLVS